MDFFFLFQHVYVLASGVCLCVFLLVVLQNHEQSIRVAYGVKSRRALEEYCLGNMKILEFYNKLYASGLCKTNCCA